LSTIKTVCQNKKAFHDYFIEETFEAGLVLVGTEVKSLRLGKANLNDSYARIKGTEVFLISTHISPYAQADSFAQIEPRRTRKLLLNKREIKRLIGKTREKGFPCKGKEALRQARDYKEKDRRKGDGKGHERQGKALITRGRRL
jgi:SsrA-binding protein